MASSPIFCRRDKKLAKRKANDEQHSDDERDDFADIDEPLYERLSPVVVETIPKKRDIDGGQIQGNGHVMVDVENDTADAAKLDGGISLDPSFKSPTPRDNRVIISDNGVYR